MAGGDDDDDETLIADVAHMEAAHGTVDTADESTDDGRTLVVALPRDDGDETLVAPLLRLSPRGPLPPPGALPRTGPARVPAQRPQPLPDVSLDKRALPFTVGGQKPLSSAPPPRTGFLPVTRTQEMPNISRKIVPAAPRVPSIPAVSAPRTAPPPPIVAAPTPVIAAPAPAPIVAAPASPAPPAPTPDVRPPLDSLALPPAEGTPPFVIRFLLVCGLLTVLGLLALIYLEL